MIQVKAELLAALQTALQAVVAEVAPDAAAPVAAFESPKQASHGDFAITAAMPLAKSLKKNPREIADRLVAALNMQPAVQRWVQQLEIAGPGFINLRLAAAAKQTVVAEVLAQGADFGRQPAQPEGAGRVMVEFVSANPTGPLHVGHGRQAALGDSICNLLQTQGRSVQREFYYNDAGVQIATLAHSTQARLKGSKPGDATWPESAYNGEYIADIAADFLAKKAVTADDRAFTASGDIEDLDSIRQFAVAYLRHEQDLDLQAFGVRFDHYFLESSLYTSGRVDDTVQRLVASGKTFEDGGALWLRSTDYGDDKDRVMRKQDGTYTYFLPDVAYHLSKWQRGYLRAITELGADHHGSLARVRAGLQSLDVGIPQGWPEYVLHQMVTVMRGGEEVKLSKRAGSYLTLRDLIDEAGRDATRWFLIARKPDSQLTFDIDLAREQSKDNPVYYVQYAHARVFRILDKAVERGYPHDQANGLLHLSLLEDEHSLLLMVELSRYPEVVENAGQLLEPHLVAQYLRELAYAFHTWYHEVQALVEDPDLRDARLALAVATRQALANGLGLLGVSAPEKM